MKNNRRRKKLIEDHPYPLKVGDCLFLVGEIVIRKVECIERTPRGFKFRDLLNQETFTYRSLTPYYTSGKPLFKNGLPAYPDDHEGLEIRWIKEALTIAGQESVSKLLKLHREFGRRTEVDALFINVVLQTAIDAINVMNINKLDLEHENWYKDALRRVFNVWRESFYDFGGIIGAMDGVGLFARDLFELNVERARRRGVTSLRVHSIVRAAKIGRERALWREGKG